MFPIPPTIDVVVARTTVVVGRGAPPPICGIGVVTVLGTVVDGRSVVNDSAAFF